MRTLILLCAVSLGCSHTERTIRQAVIGVQQFEVKAAEMLTQWDKAHQDQIARDARASRPEAGAAALAAYRKQRTEVVKLMTTLAAMAALADPMIATVDHGINKEGDIDAWLRDLMALGTRLKDALAALGILVEGGTP